MRIIAISDTHGVFPDVNTIPTGDVFVHCGDICKDFNNTFKDAEQQYAWAKENFLPWLKKINCNHKIIVPGNHDYWIQYFFDRIQEDFGIQKLSILVDDFVIIDGKMFYGSPWTYWPSKYPYDWAYGIQNKKLLEDVWDMIFPDVDILITHGPPLGILDLGMSKLENKNINMGCGSLRNKLGSKCFDRLKYHLFGHIHEHGGLFFDNCQNHQSINCCNTLVTFDI